MKKFLAFCLVLALTLGLCSFAMADETIHISILTQRHTGATTEASDLWFFKYMEYWFAQQGISVKFDVQQTAEMSQQVSLLLGTDTLPDLMWASALTPSNAILYGMEDEMILDWMPYLNEETMPNLTAKLAESPYILDSVLAPNGALYALPYLTPSISASGCYGTSERLYFRQSWLDAVGKQVPTTQEELLDVFRAFKKYADSSENGGYAVISTAEFLEKYIWTGLGFYGAEPNRYCTKLMIKDGEVVFPPYTAAYRDYIEFMHNLYTEGLIPQDYYSMDGTTAMGLMGDNKCGALCYWTLEPIGNDFKDIVCSVPICFGDNQEIHVSRLAPFTANEIWASADTAHPEIIVKLADFVYSDDGAFLYRYGVPEGTDPLGINEGYTFDEAGNVTTALVEDGTYASMSAYGRDRLFPNDYAGLRPAVVTSGTGEDIPYVDSVTGETYTVKDTAYMDPETNDGHWRLSTIANWSDRATSVRLPGAYLSADDASWAADTLNTLSTYIKAESVKFITGTRDLSEIEKFQEELKGLGVEKYLEMYRAAYEPYMNSIYGK